ncbi:MAG: undecaprenyl-diphosphate phosphatase [Firmicutes bacterium]|nr:undecaprenyl-diphosphate phosphatase [Bacillota bacterium]
MNIWQAILMGVIQGLTEFLPVSSSGHLVLGKIFFDINIETSALFEALLHVGTLGAVFVYFWKDVKMLVIEGLKIIRDLCLLIFKKKPWEDYPERRMVLFIIISSIPTVIIGLLVEAFLEDIFFGSVIAVGCALLVTGLILFSLTKIPIGHKGLEKMKYKDSVFIGLAQGIATLPGISRSGTTVAAGLFCGLDKEFAFRYSFLVGIPAILGSALLKLLKISAADAANMGYYAVGMVVAFVLGLLTVRWIAALLRKDKLHYFGYYCMAVGVISIVAGFFIH